MLVSVLGLACDLCRLASALRCAWSGEKATDMEEAESPSEVRKLEVLSKGYRRAEVMENTTMIKLVEKNTNKMVVFVPEF